ncbi:hypothetical protein GWI33_018025 [Rhynchophorus ferrugineus]|uniref:Protein kinase domain-containing protein n=1 Tax=Rhynchophorus ferrugineus TaxID=354439 RepID=A0A834HUN5_RHYFE|nr:hypothetical protein GWI33_018025 [Rhynchophorus ferrugineus]
MSIDHIDTFYAKYRILEKIGEGSFSDVLKCQQKSTGTLYAAKKLKKHYKSESCVMTCAEVVAAQKVPYHINILNMFEYHYDSFSGQVIFLFELMDMSLYDHIKARKKTCSKPRGLSENKAKAYLYQLLKGLEHLHRNGLFHRDVKPENILIKFPSIEGSRLYNIMKYDIIKLADLGSVRGIYSVPPYTEYISTRWYRSPECLLTNGNYGPKMDVWAVGCVFYEMITLLPLFPGSNEIDQLSKIHQVVGSPPVQFLNKLKSRSRNCIAFPKIRGSGINSLLPNLTHQGRSVLELMLEYDSDKRINVRRLINNSYFDDMRHKFEPFIEGSQLDCNRLRDYGKRNSAEAFRSASYVNSKTIKKTYTTESRKTSHVRVNEEIKGSSKSRTPSIEIPYYPAMKKSDTSRKISSLPLIDYKISKMADEHQRSNSSDTNNSDKLSRRSSLKRSVELILRTSRNSNSSNTPNSKSKTDRNLFQSRSSGLPNKKISRTVNSSSANGNAKKHK